MALHLLKICGIKHDLEDFNYVKGRAALLVSKKGTRGWNLLQPHQPHLPVLVTYTCTDGPSTHKPDHTQFTMLWSFRYLNSRGFRCLLLPFLLIPITIIISNAAPSLNHFVQSSLSVEASLACCAWGHTLLTRRLCFSWVWTKPTSPSCIDPRLLVVVHSGFDDSWVLGSGQARDAVDPHVLLKGALDRQIQALEASHQLPSHQLLLRPWPPLPTRGLISDLLVPLLPLTHSLSLPALASQSELLSLHFLLPPAQHFLGGWRWGWDIGSGPNPNWWGEGRAVFARLEGSHHHPRVQHPPHCYVHACVHGRTPPMSSQ